MNRQLLKTRKRIEAEVAKLKHDVGASIAEFIDAKQMTQQKVFELTGEAPSQVSLVYTGKLRGFSLERLIRMRVMLGASANLHIKWLDTQPKVEFSGSL